MAMPSSLYRLNNRIIKFSKPVSDQGKGGEIHQPTHHIECLQKHTLFLKAESMQAFNNSRNEINMKKCPSGKDVEMN
jgi:hypothetical protein